MLEASLGWAVQCPTHSLCVNGRVGRVYQSCQKGSGMWEATIGGAERCRTQGWAPLPPWLRSRLFPAGRMGRALRGSAAENSRCPRERCFLCSGKMTRNQSPVTPGGFVLMELELPELGPRRGNGCCHGMLCGHHPCKPNQRQAGRGTGRPQFGSCWMR